MAASVAVLSTVAAAPPVPRATGCGVCWYGAACAATGVASAVAMASSASAWRVRMRPSRRGPSPRDYPAAGSGTRRMSAVRGARRLVRRRVT